MLLVWELRMRGFLKNVENQLAIVLMSTAAFCRLSVSLNPYENTGIRV